MEKFEVAGGEEPERRDQHHRLPSEGHSFADAPALRRCGVSQGIYADAALCTCGVCRKRSDNYLKCFSHRQGCREFKNSLTL